MTNKRKKKRKTLMALVEVYGGQRSLTKLYVVNFES